MLCSWAKNKQKDISSLKWLVFLSSSFLPHPHYQLRTSPCILLKIRGAISYDRWNHLPFPSTNSHHLACPLFLCSFLLSVCLVSSEASPFSWDQDSILWYLFREWIFYSLFGTAVSLPPGSFPSATDKRAAVSSIFNFPSHFAPFLCFLLEPTYLEEFVSAHYITFLSLFTPHPPPPSFCSCHSIEFAVVKVNQWPLWCQLQSTLLCAPLPPAQWPPFSTHCCLSSQGPLPSWLLFYPWISPL